MRTEEKFTFFYGGPFSNFHPVYFTDVGGISYSCTEQYYMAKKAKFFKDNYHYEMIMNENNPKQQKKYGRKVNNFSRTLWYGAFADDNPAKKIMYKGNFLKYTQNEKLRKMLLDTEGTELVEASPRDDLWGIGLEADNFQASRKRFWRGKNWLGEILTQIREDIIRRDNRLF